MLMTMDYMFFDVNYWDFKLIYICADVKFQGYSVYNKCFQRKTYRISMQQSHNNTGLGSTYFLTYITSGLTGTSKAREKPAPSLFFILCKVLASRVRVKFT